MSRRGGRRRCVPSGPPWRVVAALRDKELTRSLLPNRRQWPWNDGPIGEDDGAASVVLRVFGAGPRRRGRLFRGAAVGGSAADAPYGLRASIAARSPPACAPPEPSTRSRRSSSARSSRDRSSRFWPTTIRPVKPGQVVARLYAEQIKSRRDAAAADLDASEGRPRSKRAPRSTSPAPCCSAREAAAQDIAAQRDRASAQLADAQRNLDAARSFSTAPSARKPRSTRRSTQLGDPEGGARLRRGADRLERGPRLVGLDGRYRARRSAGEIRPRPRSCSARRSCSDIEIDLARTDISSPVDGVVVKRDIDLGQTVAASLSAPTLFTIAQDLREIDIYANIDEADVGRMKEDQRSASRVTPIRTAPSRAACAWCAWARRRCRTWSPTRR